MKKFYVIGLNYKKADAEIRGLFSVDEKAKTAIMLEAKNIGISSLSILSTCNRTELYGFADHPFQLIKLLCKYTKGSIEEFEKVAYIYKGNDTVNHLFKVGTGLDSQVLGDFEIISQLRKSFDQAKEENMLNSYMERLMNSVVQASKKIKTQTTISTGATSVSYASVQYIKNTIPDFGRKNILLFGTGEIGRNTVENLLKHTQNKRITLINRTQINAETVASKYDLIVKGFEELESEIAQADILIVATGAPIPTVTKKSLQKVHKPLLVIDLSIPKNVCDEVVENNWVQKIHLDELSQIIEETYYEREAQIPEAIEIIEEVKQEFDAWVNTRQFVPTIQMLKEKLNDIKGNEINYQSKKLIDFNAEHAEILSNRMINKIITCFVTYFKSDEVSIEDGLEMITEVFQLEKTAHE